MDYVHRFTIVKTGHFLIVVSWLFWDKHKTGDFCNHFGISLFSGTSLTLAIQNPRLTILLELALVSPWWLFSLALDLS